MGVLGQREWDFLFRVSQRIVPEAQRLGPDGRKQFRAIAEEALSERPSVLQRQFRLFLAVVRYAPAARYLAPFDWLDATRQDAVLAWFQDCPLGLVRKGFWGLKSLVYMGYYGRAEVWDSIGYRPDTRGNERLRVVR
ncbi:MAG: hypothetical protein HYY25_00055 [Candidatus Wallbacteria bacterium]|nr:hypothetical protein [Candidatus Wallbacteria bacterium]